MTSDVLIVGSGPVAAACARRLLERDRRIRVTLIDAGGPASRRPGEHLRNDPLAQRDPDRFAALKAALLEHVSVPVAADPAIRRLDPSAYVAPRVDRPGNINPLQSSAAHLPAAAVTRALGGMGILWTCLAPRLHPELELDRSLPAREWDRLYPIAESYLSVGALSGSRRQEVLLEILRARGMEAVALPVAAVRRGDRIRWTGPWEILEPFHHDPRLERVPHCLARRLVVSGGRVCSVETVDMASGEVAVRHAGSFVVAGGALLTPQLLWSSRIQRGDTALGRYLCDHPLACAQVIVSREVVDRLRQVTGHGGAVPIEDADPPPVIALPVSAERPYHGVILDGAGDARLEGRVDDLLLLDLYWYARVAPRRENRVTFDERRHDALGMPRPTFDYRLTPDERDHAARMVDDLRRVGQLIGGFTPFGPPRLTAAGSSRHLMGTTRMGEHDDGTSVTDTSGRVWGMDNLFLAGTGLLGTATAANPTLTAAALAIRSADAILDSILDSRPGSKRDEGQ